MKTTICTLVEGDYHYGLGALVNSLYRNGFRGVVWTGYKGKLPPWANPVNKNSDYEEYKVSDECFIRFVQVNVDYHLTSYKPKFMSAVWEKYYPSADAIFYLDADLVVDYKWSFFEEWASYGVALCEDMFSPMHSTHPIRQAWRKFYEPHGYSLSSNDYIYVNGGFVGLTKENKPFLDEWEKILNIMAEKIDLKKLKVKDRLYMFNSTDQDALNITLMTSKSPLSIVGKEAMELVQRSFNILPHAHGLPKPWNKNMLFEAFKGKRPTLADKKYWEYAKSPIKLFSSITFLQKKLSMIASLLITRVIKQ